jgi:hypothetical protein
MLRRVYRSKRETATGGWKNEEISEFRHSYIS